MAGRATWSQGYYLWIRFSPSYFCLMTLTACIPVMMGMLISISSKATCYFADVLEFELCTSLRAASKKSQASWPFESMTSLLVMPKSCILSSTDCLLTNWSSTTTMVPSLGAKWRVLLAFKYCISLLLWLSLLSSGLDSTEKGS